jgi:hypothetical protein
MSATQQIATQSIDSIIDQLDRFRQRATYGAVAAVLNRPPRNLMSGRARSQRESWIVSRNDGMPTGYQPDQVHPEIKSRDQILKSAEELATWLESPS